MTWLLIGAAVLIAAAAGSLWYAFQRPTFVAGLTAIVGGAIAKAVLPNILKRKSPEEEAKDHALARRGKGGRINRGKIHN